jgi:NAD(P) transhydrogenase subunit alpha
MLMTAAGTITPSRVLVMGVGVAGLQAIGTAKRLGAIVEATDVRPETKEQVESLGGKFLMVQGVEYKQGTGGYAVEQSDEYKKAQAAMISGGHLEGRRRHHHRADPGPQGAGARDRGAGEVDARGSVIVDLASEQGGNVAAPRPGRTS